MRKKFEEERFCRLVRNGKFRRKSFVASFKLTGYPKIDFGGKLLSWPSSLHKIYENFSFKTVYVYGIKVVGVSILWTG